ncbi:hypothetical protein E4S40_03855 [Algoriphagus kandeliae]|uniref:Uncharacterized protein n=1 Tax=Algoriphagus kandeliae TaxID=2562278 RepID=A0A4Y9R2A4_9BACT|nr:hypothetical protein [Algoriphagus kandeliae]TFV97783.1 hypothetical protein E4S40_03855 [Algoriphagus kandeliae]
MKPVHPELIAAIERTAKKLKEGAAYQWGHMGACNCGNLAQELTPFTKAEIHRYAMERSGDWNDQILEFCPSSGYPLDLIIERMLAYGVTLEDLKHLERLSSPEVLSKMPLNRRNSLSHNKKEDVIYYLETWGKLLREKWENQQPELKIDTLKKNSISVH